MQKTKYYNFTRQLMKLFLSITIYCRQTDILYAGEGKCIFVHFCLNVKLKFVANTSDLISHMYVAPEDIKTHSSQRGPHSRAYLSLKATRSPANPPPPTPPPPPLALDGNPLQTTP